MTGTIKRLMADKGFGFIADAQGVEYFFHRSAALGNTWNRLREGAAVTFEVEVSSKGPRATDVREG